MAGEDGEIQMWERLIRAVHGEQHLEPNTLPAVPAFIPQGAHPTERQEEAGGAGTMT